jgi:uncharacterized Tic20 family protein
MTEPPRPPGDGTGDTPGPDPTAPQPPPASSIPGDTPGPAYAPPPPPPGGYAPPPGGYAPPPGGYPAGGYAPPGAQQAGPGFAPPGYPSADDKTWALIAHFGGAAGMFIGGGVLGWIAPLIAYLAKGQQSPTVRAHTVAALNFQLTWSIIGFVGYLLACLFIGFIPIAAAVILGVVFGVIAGIKANEGQLYRYPMSINIIK